MAAVEAGLARAGARGIHDLFRDRLVVPIPDVDSRVLAFAARAIRTVDAIPKYLNTPSTPLYAKRREVLGWPNAAAIRAAGSVLVVEGPIDALALWSAGFRSVVALCGTALTEEILTRLAALTPRIDLVLDGDAAGRAACRRSLLLPGGADVDLGVIPLPDGLDPGAIIAADPGAWPALAARRRTRWGHLWAETLAPFRSRLRDDVEARVEWKDAWCALVAENVGYRDEGRRLLAPIAERLGISATLLDAEYLSALPTSSSDSAAASVRPIGEAGGELG